MRNWHQLGGAVVFAAALCTSAIAQDASAELSADQVYVLADGLAQEGQLAQAVSLSEALLQRDPKDVRALMLLANIANNTGDAEAARTYAARAYGATTDRNARYVAARLAARGHADAGQDTRAQIWLRRALQHAPNQAARAEIVADYNFVRQRNPLAVDLRFGVTPSSNINNGSAKAEVALFGPGTLVFALNNEAQAQSGLEVFGGVGLRYRIAESATRLTTAVFDLDVTRAVLSPSAKDALQADYEDKLADRLEACDDFSIPAADCPVDFSPATGADFSTIDLSFGLEHRMILRPGMLPTTLTANLGQSWFGGDPYTQFANVAAKQGWALPGNATVNVELGYTLTDYVDDGRDENGNRPDADATRVLGVGWAKRFQQGDVVRLDLGRTDNTSDTLDREYRSRTFELGYDFGQPFNGVKIGLGVNFEQRVYDTPRFGTGIRTDTTRGAQISAQFNEVEYYGFQPVVTLKTKQTDSSVDLYDRDTTSLGFDLVSTF